MLECVSHHADAGSQSRARFNAVRIETSKTYFVASKSHRYLFQTVSAGDL